MPADVDECSTSNGGCAHTCSNLEGSYVCSCRDGFMLGGDSVTCEDINECLAMSHCDHTCDNLVGGFRCSCDAGYVLDEDLVSCNGMLACVRACQHMYMCKSHYLNSCFHMTL